MKLEISSIDTPLGPVGIVVRRGKLVMLSFLDGSDLLGMARAAYPGASFELGEGAELAARHIGRYFDGDLKALGKVAVAPRGTVFQRRVWAELRKIPAGAMVSYGEVARRLGSPGAMRAVGNANARNPVALVVPCHRVVAENRKIGGYSGGIERKEWLLRHEGALLA